VNQYKFRCPLIATISLVYSAGECIHFRRSGVGNWRREKAVSVPFTTEESIHLISDKRLTRKTLMVSICATRLGVQKFYVMLTKFIYALGIVSGQTKQLFARIVLADLFL